MTFIFIWEDLTTMTCSPGWKEVVANLKTYETVIDRPDIVGKVFHQTVRECKELVIKIKLKKTMAFTCVIKF